MAEAANRDAAANPSFARLLRQRYSLRREVASDERLLSVHLAVLTDDDSTIREMAAHWKAYKALIPKSVDIMNRLIEVEQALSPLEWQDADEHPDEPQVAQIDLPTQSDVEAQRHGFEAAYRTIVACAWGHALRFDARRQFWERRQRNRNWTAGVRVAARIRARYVALRKKAVDLAVDVMAYKINWMGSDDDEDDERLFQQLMVFFRQ